jgi:4'-phosphopantetheinyl transferase
MELDLSGGTRLIWLPLDLPARELEAMSGWLSPDEHERAARFQFPRDRDRYIAGRAAMRAILGQALDRDPARIRFCYGSRGKPALEPHPLDLHFSMSHSQGMAVLALQFHDEVGVDLEMIREVPDALSIAGRFFAPEESRVLEAATAPHERDLVFAQYWTRKEALLKSIGHGLSFPANTFVVPSGELIGPLAIALRHGDERHARWLLPTPPCPPGYVTALATAGGPRPVAQIDSPLD